MRWLADECVDAMLVTRLRGAGHDTVYMAEVAQSTSDADIIAWAQREARLLLTEDKDFAGAPRCLGSFCCASIRAATN